jgi:WXG100 family type VII secretion target
MSASCIRMDYDEGRAIEACFAQHANNTRQLQAQVRSQVDSLAQGGWIGRGAEQFYAEMDNLVLPAMERLVTALDVAQQATRTIAQRFQSAEEEAGALFQGSAADSASAGIPLELSSSLSNETRERINKVLGDGSSFTPVNLQRFNDALGAERTADILNKYNGNLGEQRLKELLTDPNYAQKYVLPDARNADFFHQTWEYNGFRRVFDGKDVPPGVSNQARWVNAQNVKELQAALAQAEQAGVDVSFRKAQAGEELHHIVPAADGRARAARERLMELGIHPNSAFNGVGMDKSIHKHIHNDRYYAALTDTLNALGNARQAQTFLDDLARHVDSLPKPNNPQEAKQLADRVVKYIREYAE